MLLDLIGAIALTFSAAVVVATLVAALPWNVPQRVRAAATLATWFAAVATLGATGALDAFTGLGPAGLGVVLVAPIAILLWAGRNPRLLAPAVARIPLEVLIGVNAVRILGVFFVLLYAAGRLPAPFAPSAGWGDIVVGALALPVAWLVAKGARGWRSAALAWNTLGLLDLVVAVGLGVTSSPGSPLRIFTAEPSSAIMTSLPWLLIPGFLVPLLALTHVAVFARLLAPRVPLATARA
jgi:hypothetical protein